MRDFIRDCWPALLIVVLVLMALAGLIVWAALQPNGGCPPHTVSTITGWIPISTGKTVIMDPIVSCVAGAK